MLFPAADTPRRNRLALRLRIHTSQHQTFAERDILCDGRDQFEPLKIGSSHCKRYYCWLMHELLCYNIFSNFRIQSEPLVSHDRKLSVGRVSFDTNYASSDCLPYMPDPTYNPALKRPEAPYRRP